MKKFKERKTSQKIIERLKISGSDVSEYVSSLQIYARTIKRKR